MTWVGAQWGNEVEVGVVVQESNAVALGDGREEQVWKAGGAVLAPTRQRRHELDGAIEIGLVYREPGIAKELFAGL